jgi:hypothetical protein
VGASSVAAVHGGILGKAITSEKEMPVFKKRKPELHTRDKAAAPAREINF